jgi:hypothetical protein
MRRLSAHASGFQALTSSGYALAVWASTLGFGVSAHAGEGSAHAWARRSPVWAGRPPVRARCAPARDLRDLGRAGRSPVGAGRSLTGARRSPTGDLRNLGRAGPSPTRDRPAQAWAQRAQQWAGPFPTAWNWRTVERVFSSTKKLGSPGTQFHPPGVGRQPGGELLCHTAKAAVAPSGRALTPDPFSRPHPPSLTGRGAPPPSQAFAFLPLLPVKPPARTLTPGPSPFPSHPPSQGEGNPRPLTIQAFLFAFSLFSR